MPVAHYKGPMGTPIAGAGSLRPGRPLAVPRTGSASTGPSPSLADASAGSTSSPSLGSSYRAAGQTRLIPRGPSTGTMRREQESSTPQTPQKPARQLASAVSQKAGDQQSLNGEADWWMSVQARQHLLEFDERLQRIEGAIAEASGEKVPMTPAGVRCAVDVAQKAANTVLSELEVVIAKVEAESSLRKQFEENLSQELRHFEARLEGSSGFSEKSMADFAQQLSMEVIDTINIHKRGQEKSTLDHTESLEHLSMQTIEAINTHKVETQQAVSEVTQVLLQTGARLQCVEDFCASVDRAEANLSFSAGTGMQETSRLGLEKGADLSVMSLERLQLEEKLSQELEKVAQRQDETIASLRKHMDSMMEATIDTNHQASSLVLAQLDELSVRVQTDNQNMVVLEEKVSQEIQKIAKMYQELGSAMTHQLRIFEDSNQQAAQSIELHGKHAREGLAEANLRFSALESRCATIDEQLLEQHERLLDKIGKVSVSVNMLGASGKKASDSSGGQAMMGSQVADRLVELEHRTGCMVPAEEINKMFEYERDQREAGLKHLLTSVIEENLQGLRGLEDTVDKRFNDEASARSELETKITASLATLCKPMEASQTELFAVRPESPAVPQKPAAAATAEPSMVLGMSASSSSSTFFQTCAQPINVTTPAAYARQTLSNRPRSPPHSPSSSRMEVASSVSGPASSAATEVSRLQPQAWPAQPAQAWQRLQPVLRQQPLRTFS